MSSNLPSTSSYPGEQPTDSDTPADEGADVVSPLLSSFLDELRNDDTTTVYSYFSTVSTNYTMSNLPGPGRLLGNFYSRAGRALEKRLGRIVNRAAIKEYEDAVDILLQRSWNGSIHDMFDDDDPSENERACEILLVCAKSDDAAVQTMAFEKIVWYFVYWPSKVRSAFRRVFEQRNEISDVIAFSWRRPDIEYSLRWLFLYKLASRCLSSHQSSFFEDITQFDDVDRESLDFLQFEGLLLSCGDVTDFVLALRLIELYWDREGVEGYILDKGFNDPVIVQFANGLIIWLEIYVSEPDPNKRVPFLFTVFRLTNTLLEGVTRSSRNVNIDGLDRRFEYDATIAMWAVVFKMYHFLRSIEPRRVVIEDIPVLCKPWRELCHESLPNPEHVKLRQSLLRLEDIHGSAIRNSFPPEENSAMDREGKYLKRATQVIAGLVPCIHCVNPMYLESDLTKRYWGRPSWYDDQLRICEEMMILTKSTMNRTSCMGIPYTIKIGQVAPNACNVCYRALLRRRQRCQRWRYLKPRLPLSPIMVILTHHRGILTLFVLYVTALDRKDRDGDDVLKSFEGGFRLRRKDMIHFTYEEQLEEERDDE
ncbi:hypothetical protein SCHPADRAFT_906835 [Schizopora paradoxa]|uniref:Uncharacterized protein n=1 Tax=Schizopora paradoxa TaxID=27342 RepID=A0A0H2RFE9_9AGAM|nr:hypothetical protein SCHPADRAFT_906835 [Schizopora paradoxa]